MRIKTFNGQSDPGNETASSDWHDDGIDVFHLIKMLFETFHKKKSRPAF